MGKRLWAEGNLSVVFLFHSNLKLSFVPFLTCSQSLLSNLFWERKCEFWGAGTNWEIQSEEGAATLEHLAESWLQKELLISKQIF